MSVRPSLHLSSTPLPTPLSSARHQRFHYLPNFPHPILGVTWAWVSRYLSVWTLTVLCWTDSMVVDPLSPLIWAVSCRNYDTTVPPDCPLDWVPFRPMDMRRIPVLDFSTFPTPPTVWASVSVLLRWCRIFFPFWVFLFLPWHLCSYTGYLPPSSPPVSLCLDDVDQGNPAQSSAPSSFIHFPYPIGRVGIIWSLSTADPICNWDIWNRDLCWCWWLVRCRGSSTSGPWHK